MSLFPLFCHQITQKKKNPQDEKEEEKKTRIWYDFYYCYHFGNNDGIFFSMVVVQVCGESWESSESIFYSPSIKINSEYDLLSGLESKIGMESNVLVGEHF